MRTLAPTFLAMLVVLVSLRTGRAQPAQPAATSVELPAIQAVGISDHGMLTVNGQPFFPILLYASAHDDAALAEFRAAGFNTLTAKPANAEALRRAGLYAVVHAPGPKSPVDPSALAGILLGLGADSPAMYFKDNLVQQTREANAKVAAQLPGRPVMSAIGYWLDEPKGVIDGTLPPPEKYEQVAAALDVAAPYLYPVPYQPISTVGDAVTRAVAAVNGKKPVIPILQLFTWDAKARYPTPDELRCMVFLAVVQGASGIGYYDYDSVTGEKGKTIAQVQSELWTATKAINADLKALSPLITATAPGAALKPPQGVCGRVFGGAAESVLVLVNPTDKTVAIELAKVAAGVAPLSADDVSFTLPASGIRLIKARISAK